MVEIVARQFRCPDIRSQADAQAIMDSLANSPEVESTEVCVGTRLVTVHYCDHLDERRIVQQLREAGFPVEDD